MVDTIQGGRDEGEHARLVKERIDELGLDVVTNNRKVIVAEKNFTATEKCAFYSSNICSYLCGAIFVIPLLFCYGCSCCYLNYPMKAYVYSAFGRVRFTETKETHSGIRCRCCHNGLEKTEVDLKLMTMTARGSSVPDATGSPLNVSAMISYVVVDPVAYLYSVENTYSFV